MITLKNAILELYKENHLDTGITIWGNDDDVNGTTTHKDAIAAIKAKWPKDNSGPV